jgi:hypothetical protein
MNRGQFTALALGAALEIPLAAAELRNVLELSVQAPFLALDALGTALPIPSRCTV